jgi:sulfatase maturation enzyme AslB (radical SAM superfamily)
MIDNAKINQFFDDIKYVLTDNSNNLKLEKKLIKQTNDKQGDQRTNVIYLNTDCNLRCEYCYEDDSRKGLPDQVSLKTVDIDYFLQEIMNRESDTNSTVVIMGGEPFLRFDLVKYIINKCAQLVKPKGWGISIVTNGTLFTTKRLEEFKELSNLCVDNKIALSLEISYDGSGQHRRKWPDGSSSRDKVEKCLNSLVEYGIPFKISYVVHRDNHENVIEDVITIFEKWPSLERLIIGFAYLDLDKAFNEGNSGQKIKKKLKPYFEEVFKIYNKPICDMTCSLCRLCRKDNFVGNSYLSPTTGISYDLKETEHMFQQF